MLTRLRLENFKSWRDTGEIALKPITGFFGPNSSGKTSLFQALLLMKQTDDSSDRGIVFHFGDGKTPVDLGDFESVVHEHDTERTLKLSLGWNAKREIVIPDAFDGGTVAKGDDIGFEVETREESIGSEKSLVLERMAYRIADGRQFGMRRLPDGKGYTLFVRGSDIDFSHYEEDLDRYGRPFKFYHFPYGEQEHFQSEAFVFYLPVETSFLLSSLYYLGPLRVNPHRIYARSGAQPPDMGPAGESVVDAILSSRERDERIEVTGRKPNLTGRKLDPTLDEYVAEWLKRLGLVHDFRVEALAEGRRWFEVKVRKSPHSAEVLLTDIGFGVSQILPVLVLCFYAPPGSTVILEQPDLHLHPSVQAGLADVFIDAWKKRNVQILFESHSEHLLRRFQRRIAEEDIPEKDVGLFFCSMDSSGGSSLSPLKVDEFGNIANWPKDFFGDQFGEIAAMSEAALKKHGDSE